MKGVRHRAANGFDMAYLGWYRMAICLSSEFYHEDLKGMKVVGIEH